MTVWNQKDQKGPIPAPPNIMISGGPGSGKSCLTRERTRLIKEHQLSVLSSAMMAVAAGNMMGGRTVHSLYNISVDRSTNKKKKKEQNVFLKEISGKKTRLFRSRIEKGLSDRTPIATIIDEISMLSTIRLGQILGRYSDIEDFVQWPMILVGDMWQIRPVGGTPIFQSMMENIDNPVTQNTPAARAISLLKTVRVFHLDEQQRSLNEIHTNNIKKMTTTNPNVFPMTPELLRCYPPISAEDIKSDPLWHQASTVVPTNPIRHQINQSKIKSHALHVKLPVLFWRNELVGENAGRLTEAETETLHASHPALTSYFVPGALAFIIDNISTFKGIVNGSSCTFHSLTLDPREDEVRIEEKMDPLSTVLENPIPGEMIELALPPLSINVTLSQEVSADFTADDTLVAGSAVVPIPIGAYPRTEHLKSYELLRRQEYPFKSVSFKIHGVELGYACTYIPQNSR